MLAMEIWFGVMLVAASRLVSAAAQPVCRLARGRRFSRLAMTYLLAPQRGRVEG